jgi:shikimate dehydrogenase
MLSGRTVFTAIFGDPVEHSQSPAMHNAAYAALGLERAYIAFHVVPEKLNAAIHAIAPLGMLGVNLTVPHKERALRMMTSISEEARILGAINCVVNRSGSLHGDNTDARGLENDLRSLDVSLNDRRAIVIGAGGAAAAAILACFRLGAKEITLCNRTLARAERMARRLGRFIHSACESRTDCTIEARGLDVLQSDELLASAAIVVNATPMGLKTGGFTPLAYRASNPDCFFYDLVYAAETTPFLRPAIALGRRAADGAGMLISQGELAFELFNQVAPPAGVMRRTLMERLGRKSEQRAESVRS